MLPHTKTSQLICTANQLTGFYIRATLAFNGFIFMVSSSSWSITTVEHFSRKHSATFVLRGKVFRDAYDIYVWNNNQFHPLTSMEYPWERTIVSGCVVLTLLILTLVLIPFVLTHFIPRVSFSIPHENIRNLFFWYF